MFAFSLLVSIAQDKDLELSYCIPSVCMIGSSRIVVISQDMTISIFYLNNRTSTLAILLNTFLPYRVYCYSLPVRLQYTQYHGFKHVLMNIVPSTFTCCTIYSYYKCTIQTDNSCGVMPNLTYYLPSYC